MTCKGCTMRHVGCHGTCENYIKEKENLRKANEWRKQKRKESMDICRKMIYTFNR